MELQGKKKRNSVFFGVAVLTVASLLVKVVGVFYKIPLTYLLGDEGMGYFNSAYTIYAWLYMISTAGLPIGVSILISEADAAGDVRRVSKVTRIAGILLLTLGTLTTAFMLLFARFIAGLLGSPDAVFCMIAIAPTLFFICVSSLFRGFFQGFQCMMPTAVSQLLEAIGKLVLGLLFARVALTGGKPLPVVCAFAILGVTVGTAISTLYLTVRFLLTRHKMKSQVVSAGEKRQTSGGGILMRLIKIAFPVTVSASVMSLTGLIDLGMMIRRLVSIGYTRAEATALFGNYTTLVVPMFNLPSVVVTPIATGVIPAISRAVAGGDEEEVRSLAGWAFRYAAWIAVPASLGLCAFAKPILSLLYPAESVVSAFRLLSYVSPAVYFLCLLTVSNAVLQARGHSAVPMIGMLCGGVAKTVAGYFLMGTPSVGIIGAPVGTVICYVVAFTVNTVMLGRKTKYYPSVRDTMFLPLLAAVPAIGVSWLVYDRLFLGAGAIGTIICVALAAGLYLCFSLWSGLVKAEEIRRLLRRKKTQKQTSGT